MNDDVIEAYGQQELGRYSHWVYVLSCRLRQFCETFNDYERYIDKRLSYEPEWKRMAWEADRCVYVGQTENLKKRIGEHFKNKNSSDFTEVWQPHEIRTLRPVKSRNSAEYEEKRIGKSYYDVKNTYAYWK
jgi:predicted GIY-YIG superfamily endonuclease